MFIVVSPAKKMQSKVLQSDLRSTPSFSSSASQLVDVMRDKSVSDLRSLMGISEKLASLNVQRFTDFNTDTTGFGEPAVGLFAGDTYVGLDATTLSANQLDFAQEHLGILSGLYGVLSPLDTIQPYRLEMGTRLKTEHGKNLYEFWGDSVTDKIAKSLEDHNSKILINLASNEYFSVINTNRLKDEYGISVLTPVFKEVDRKNGTVKLKIISFSAKRARGMMARYIVQNALRAPKAIQQFSETGYGFRADLSSESEWIFVR